MKLNQDERIKFTQLKPGFWETSQFSIASTIFKSAFFVETPPLTLYLADDTPLTYIGIREKDYGGGHTVEFAIYKESNTVESWEFNDEFN